MPFLRLCEAQYIHAPNDAPPSPAGYRFLGLANGACFLVRIVGDMCSHYERGKLLGVCYRNKAKLEYPFSRGEGRDSHLYWGLQALIRIMFSGFNCACFEVFVNSRGEQMC